MVEECIRNVQEQLKEGHLAASENLLGACTMQQMGKTDASSVTPGATPADPVAKRTDLWKTIAAGLSEDAKCTLNIDSGAVEVVPNKGRACE